MTIIVQNIYSKQVLENFGVIIKRFREERNLPLRKVAAALDIDTSTLSKIERGERNANKEIVQRASFFFEVDLSHLIIEFMSDKVAYDLLHEDDCDRILKVAEEKVKYLRSKNTRQGSLKFNQKNEK